MTDDTTSVPPDPVYLCEADLARRWAKSVRSLQRWRALGYGPAHIRLRGGVRYDIDDIRAFEARLRSHGGVAE